jgi:RNA polymerase primary sigma factor
MPIELFFRIYTELLLQPGLTARQLAAMIGEDKSNINSVLYRYPEHFKIIRRDPPEWVVVGASNAAADQPTALPPIPPTVVSRSSTALTLDLYQWQREALHAWNSNGQRGIVNAVTGAGKTRLALAAIRQHLDQPNSNAAVIVPTIELLRQWHRQLCEWFPDHKVGMLGGGEDDFLDTNDILVAVMNSASTYSLGLPNGTSGLLIGDECHRLASPKNQHALEAYFQSRLGLSATHERLDGGHETILIPYFGSVIYELTYKQAIAQDVISPVKVATIAVEFTPEEMADYDRLTDEMGNARRMLSSNFGLHSLTPGEFFTEVSKLANSNDRRASIAANRYLRPYRARRTLLAESRAKIEALGILAGAVQDANGTIAFTESIDSTNDIVDAFATRSIVAEAIHSKLRPDERREIFEQFSDGLVQLISAPQVLDEGIDVPEADLAIIVAGTSQRRQMVQRMGRVMRKKQDHRFARFAILYVKGTHEDPTKGAHEEFLNEILEVAEDWENFAASSSPQKVRNFLKPF